VKQARDITCLFVDIGGVLLTNGWDHHARKRAAIRDLLKEHTVFGYRQIGLADEQVLVPILLDAERSAAS